MRKKIFKSNTGKKIHFKKQVQLNELKKEKSCTDYRISIDGHWARTNTREILA